MNHVGSALPKGDLSLTVIRGGGGYLKKDPRPPHRGHLIDLPPISDKEFWRLLKRGLPSQSLHGEIRRWRMKNLPNLFRGVRKLLLARAFGLPHFYGRLELVVFRSSGEVLPYGLASLRLVTTAGVTYLTDALQNLVEPELLKFHGIGTGVVAEAIGDTALGAELTTAYNPDNTRATGNLAEGASGNIFHTEGTNTVDATVAITEHGVFTQAATGGGTLLDRSVFAAVNLVSGDSMLSKYELTLNSGG